jgi:4-diphosphocytidyl-2-C-methyl-D-erythritol kinase
VSQQSLTTAGDEPAESAWAKLNLGLRVLSRRQDGFHDLVGVFQTVSLADDLRIRDAPRLELTCSDPALPTGEQNLAFRAAQLYLHEVGGSPCQIHLHKRIPAGAGLGGGSADAAAVLRAMERRASRPAGAPALAQLGAQLGSDVPFALYGGTALVEGRGERVQPLVWAAPATWYVLVCPQAPVDTGWAYAELARQRAGSRLSDSDAYRRFIGSARGGRLDATGLWSVIDNDFQPLIEGAKPIVARASQLRAGTGPLTHSMSGSGSTVYGVYDDRTAAERAALKLGAAGYPVFLCTPVPAATS